MALDSKRVTEQLRRILAAPESREVKAARAAGLIREAGEYRWVGLYDVGDADITVLAWSGPAAPSHPRFPVTDGLNGAAVHSGEAVIVGDVSRDARYLTTHSSTRSEMTVPVKHVPLGTVVGTIDVESERVDAFSESDRSFIEQCAAALAQLWAV